MPGAYYINDLLNEKESFELDEFCKSLPGLNFFAKNFIFKNFFFLFSIKGKKRGFISGRKGPKVYVYTPNRRSTPNEIQSNCVEKLRNRFGLFAENDPKQISVNCYQNDECMVPHKDGTGSAKEEQIVFFFFVLNLFFIFFQGNVCSIISTGQKVLLDFWFKPAKNDIKGTEVYFKSNFVKTDDKDLNAKREEELGALGLFEKPDLSVLMENGSALVLSEESFFDWVHGIEERPSDKVEIEKIANKEQLAENVNENEELIRGARCSIVVWQGEYKTE